eukprot:7387494-Prymnesium_polylepis.3
MARRRLRPERLVDVRRERPFQYEAVYLGQRRADDGTRRAQRGRRWVVREADRQMRVKARCARQAAGAAVRGGCGRERRLGGDPLVCRLDKLGGEDRARQVAQAATGRQKAVGMRRAGVGSDGVRCRRGHRHLALERLALR